MKKRQSVHTNTLTFSYHKGPLCTLIVTSCAEEYNNTMTRLCHLFGAVYVLNKCHSGLIGPNGVLRRPLVIVDIINSFCPSARKINVLKATVTSQSGKSMHL